MVAFVCNSEEKLLVEKKVWKIVEWPACRNVTATWAFIGICNYYGAWIKNFSLVAGPIFRLFLHSHMTSKGLLEQKGKRRQVEFVWGAQQEKAMEKLKTALSSAPALKPLVYMLGDVRFVREIVLGVDACGLGFEVILQEEDQESRPHLVRYKNGRWTPVETQHDAVNLEGRGLLRAIKTFATIPTGFSFCSRSTCASQCTSWINLHRIYRGLSSDAG